MPLQAIRFEDLVIPEDRQRRNFKAEALLELAGSITQNGLIQPVVVREEGEQYILVAGERRVKALQYVWNFSQPVNCGGRVFAEGEVPCLLLGEIDPDDAFEIELEENIRRVDLDWQEKANAVAELFRRRQDRAESEGVELTVAAFAHEVDESEVNINPQNVRRDIILARNMANPLVAKARTPDEAYKALKREEELGQSAALAHKVGLTLTSASHTLLQGDCIELMKKMPNDSFDILLSDPPYGMGADKFNDSGGATKGAHFYDDSPENWRKLMIGFLAESWRLMKPQSHMYLFCDIDKFQELKSLVNAFPLLAKWERPIEGAWKPFRTPLTWVNPTANRAPWPEHGPHRKTQWILYAIKGNRPVNKLYPDVITVPSDINLNHPAQKPVALFEDLLRRSARPGDTVLDPFAGSGPIFPAAHGLKLIATGIELDKAAAGIAVTRLEKLK